MVRNFVVDDLKSVKSKHALDVQGFKHVPILNLQLENCTFDKLAEPSIVKNVRDLILRNVRINGWPVQALDLMSSAG